jgi:hypothetical protein
MAINSSCEFILSAAFAFPLRERVASGSEAGIEAVKPLSSLIAYDCSLENELPAVASDTTINRDERVLARLRAETHTFHKQLSIQYRKGKAESHERTNAALYSASAFWTIADNI